jgi:hypothetical protein
MKQSDLVKLVLQLQQRIEVLEEHVLGTLPPSIVPPQRMAPEPEKKRRKKPTPAEDSFELDLTKLADMSTSEIAQICRRMGTPHASRALTRDDLIALMMGEDVIVEDPLARIREGTFDFVEGNKTVLRSIMRCSLHCPTCDHDQVIGCWNTNQETVRNWSRDGRDKSN